MRRQPAVLSLLLLLPGCAGPSPNDRAEVTFRVVARDVPEPAAVYVAGSVSDLGAWEADGLRLTRASDTSWTGTVTLDAGQTIEFKITRGSWDTEGVGRDGLELPNYRADVDRDTVITVRVARWRDRVSRPALLSTERMLNKGGAIELLELWRFSPGDDPRRAQPAFDDSAWEQVRSHLPHAEPLPRGWDGIGWFRLRLEVDSTLQGRALAVFIRQTGASEWYLNGDTLFTLGTVSASPDSEVAFSDLMPHIIVLPRRADQLLAVRYSNHRAREWQGLSTGAGFYAVLGGTYDAIAGTLDRTRTVSVYQILLTTVAVLLGALHLFLFAFERREPANLYFSLLMLGVGVLTYLDFVGYVSTDPVLLLTVARLRGVPLGTVAVFAVLTAYSTGRRPFPRHAALAPVLAVAVAIWTALSPARASTIGFPALIALVSVEVIRVLVREFFARKDTGQAVGITGWIGGAGAIVYIVGVLWQILINLEVLPAFVAFPPIYMAFMIFAVGISANLAWQWSTTNRTLRQKLAEIEQLSTRALEQERMAREHEVQRRLLEADNERKTQELEEARRLQLSMLPPSVPEIAGLDIATYLRTATEVGGDYYDFLTEDDRSLTIAVGDATGHGMKAGLMVTLVKSMFHTRGNSFFIPDFFHYGTTLIRRMRMEGVYMSLMLARIRDGSLTLSSAGMPPVLVHRARTGEVEEFRLTGMPLGASPGFPYTQKSTRLAGGDTVLIMSDGLPEHFNRDREMFEIGRVTEEFRRAAGGPARAVIDALLAAADRWSDGTPPHDDMTFVVVRVKG